MFNRRWDGKGAEVERFIDWLSGVDVCVPTVEKCLIEWKKHGRLIAETIRLHTEMAARVSNCAVA